MGRHDKDGYLDLVVSGFNQTGKTLLYRNEQGLYFVKDTTVNLPQLFSTQMDWGDLDNDGDIDFVMMGIDSGDTLVNYLGFRTGDNFDLTKYEKWTLNQGYYTYNSGPDWEPLIKGDVKIADFHLDGDNEI